MVRRSRRDLVRAIRRLSVEDRTALVVAVSRARGADATVHDGSGAGPVVAASHPRLGERLLLVPEPRGRLDRLRARLGLGARGVDVGDEDRGDPDGPVPVPDSEPEVAEPRELARALLYALDREVADGLCRRHLGRPLADLHRPELDGPLEGTEGTDEDAGGSDGAVTVPVAGEVDAATVATVAVALLVVLAGVTWAAGPAGVTDGLPGGTAAPSDSADEPGGEEIPPTGGGRSVDESTPAESDEEGNEEDDEEVDVAAVRAERGDGDGYPPGLGPTGVASTGRLAASHAISASERSYVWSLTYRESSDGNLRSVRWETVRVERPGQYRTTVTGWGNATAPDTPVSTVETYGDGSTRFVRLPDGRVSTYRISRVREYGSIGLYADRSARLVRRYLETEPTRVVSSTVVDNRTYHLVYAGEGYDSSTPTTTLTVDELGMIHAFRTRFPVAGSNVTAVVAFEYSRVNATTVAAPDWYADALVAAVDPEMSGSAGNRSGGTGASTPRGTDVPATENHSDDDASRKPVPAPTETDNASRAVRVDGDAPPPSVESARAR